MREARVSQEKLQLVSLILLTFFQIWVWLYLLIFVYEDTSKTQSRNTFVKHSYTENKENLNADNFNQSNTQVINYYNHYLLDL